MGIFCKPKHPNTPDPFPEDSEKWTPGTAAYSFHIKTGYTYPQLEKTRKWDHGTMVLVVNPGAGDSESHELRVTREFHTDTEWSTMADFWLPEHIGAPKLLKIRLESPIFESDREDLYVKEITVHYMRKSYRFPVRNFLYPYHSSEKDIADKRRPPYLMVEEGAGSLRHLTSEVFLVNAREHELKVYREMIPWSSNTLSEDLLQPNYMATAYEDLPRFLQFKDAYAEAFSSLRKVGEGKIKVSSLEAKITALFGKGAEESRLGSLEQFRDHLIDAGATWSKQDMEQALKVADKIRCDKEFGRQMVSGLNSLYITKVTALHERWTAGTEDIPKHLFSGKSISDIMGSGKLFEISAEGLLDGVPHGGASNKMLAGFKATWYVTPSDCLLWVDDEGNLLPAIIRLKNKNDSQEASFWYPPPPGTPDDHPDSLSWLLAKMYFRCSDCQIYAIITHFCRGHAVNEVFAVSAHRNLPSAHPILRLLHPHIQGIVAINSQARIILVNPKSNAFGLFLSAGDHLLDVFTNYYRQTFNYQKLIIPGDIKARGVEDMGGVEYLFSDDSLALWNAISKYVGEVVELTYLSDKDVADDTELQNWTTEMVEIGFDGFKDGAGFPKKLSDRASLSELVTVIIFNISVFHAGVNFQSLTTLGYIPNCPGVLIKPPPAQGEKITMERILDTLPPKQVAFVQAHLSNLLGSLSPVEKFYLPTAETNRGGLREEVNMVCEKQLACVDRLTAELRLLQEKISERNKDREMIYDVMSPENVPLTTQS